jgi:hypothetical protein
MIPIKSIVIKENIWAGAVLILLIGFGNFGIFTGQNAFVDEDPLLNFEHNVSNLSSSGWRADVALGASKMIADPGVAHTWNLSRWWGSLFDDQATGFHTKLLIFFWVTGFVLYLFLRKTVDQLDWFTTIFLASMIVSGSLRYEWLLLYSSMFQLIAAPIIALILYQFILDPKIRHYFYFSLLTFATVFLGSAVSLFQILVFEVIFCISVAVYHRLYKNFNVLFLAIKRVVILNLVSGGMLILLGAWVFYGIFYEQLVLGYVRDPNYSEEIFFRSTTLPHVINHFSPYFHSGLLSLDSSWLGIVQKTSLGHSWNNVFPLFPVIFLAAFFFKSETFWEFSAKFIVLGSIFFIELIFWVPGLFTLAQKIVTFYALTKLHACIQIFQIVFIGFVIQKVKTGKSVVEFSESKIARFLAACLAIFYSGFLILAVGAIFYPETLAETLSSISRMAISPNSTMGPFLQILIEENVQLFNETMGWSSIFFYGFTAVLLFLFATRYGFGLVGMYGGRVFAIALFLNVVLLSLTVYPLSNKTLIWDQQKPNGVLLAEKFKPTDRIARVGIPRCANQPKYQKCIENKFFDDEFGSNRHMVGYRNIPMLEFTKTRSFTPFHVADFLKSFMKREKTNPSGILRQLQIEQPIYNSRVLGISSVNYLLSRNRLPEAEHLEQIYKNKQFYLYRNKKAWPYFYLADRIETIETYDDLYDAEKGVAYLWKDNDKIILPSKSPTQIRSLELVKFNNGDVEFKYASNEKEFLVMADSWHPDWHAHVNGNETPIIKTNGVFKGVLLPPGGGTVHLFFDNSSHKNGVWITVISWILFISGWRWCAFRLQEKW